MTTADRTQRTAADAVDVILRDGGTLRLRAPARGDVDAVVELFAHLSQRSLYLRFHGIRRIDATEVARLVEPDWRDRGALLGVLADEAGRDRVVALAEYARL